MTEILKITEAGLQAENQALITGIMPIIKDFVVDGGEAYEGYDGVSLIKEVYVAEILTKDTATVGLLKLQITLTPDASYPIRGFALRLEDGTIYAYSRYEPLSDGIFKSEAWGLQFTLMLSRLSDVTFDFTYSPLDLGVMADELSARARVALDLHLEGELLSFVYWIDGLSRRQDLQQIEINELKLKLRGV